MNFLTDNRPGICFPTGSPLSVKSSPKLTQDSRSNLTHLPAFPSTGRIPSAGQSASALGFRSGRRGIWKSLIELTDLDWLQGRTIQSTCCRDEDLLPLQVRIGTKHDRICRTCSRMSWLGYVDPGLSAIVTRNIVAAGDPHRMAREPVVGSDWQSGRERAREWLAEPLAAPSSDLVRPVP